MLISKTDVDLTTAGLSHGTKSKESAVSTGLRALIAILLIFAATAKGYEIWGVHPIVIGYVSQVIVETMLGFWVVSRVWPTASLFVAFIAFAGFSIISLVELARGAPSCGCFGALRVSPIYTFILDGAIVILLLASLTNLNPLIAKWKTLMILICGALSASAVAGVIGANHRAARLTQGKTLSLKPAKSEPGDVPALADLRIEASADSPSEWTAIAPITAPGTKIRALFRISNPTDHPIRVKNVEVSCGCIEIPDPPETIATEGSTDVEVWFTAAWAPGEWSMFAKLDPDDPRIAPIMLRIEGVVR